MPTTKKLLRSDVDGKYWAANGYYIVREHRDESDDYGKAGSVYWLIYDNLGDAVDATETLAEARYRFGILA